jgi:putative transposase
VARPLRPQVAGAIYHVHSRGNRRSAIYLDDYDRRTFLSRLAYVVTNYEWECQAFCLMTTHYHLIVTTPKPNIAAGMQYLNARYAEYFNGRHALSGHVFQGRYSSVVVESDEQLLSTHRYVALNPIRAGACAHPADWPWSSYGAVLGAQAFSFVRADKLLRHFGSGAAAVRELRHFVELGTGAVSASSTSGV